MLPKQLSFPDAALAQYRYGTNYTAWLVAPDGSREYLGYTSRKSMHGLIAVLRRESVQNRIKQFPDSDTLQMRRTGGELVFTNGWKMAFGGTIRQEAGV